MIDRFAGNYYFLSNFYPCTIALDNHLYPSAEHAFQASKTNSEIERLLIASASSPSIAKEYGRNCTLKSDWELQKNIIMLKIERIKFKDTILQRKLLATGEEELQEGNLWHDNYWGNCSCYKCRNKNGLNILGQILMQVRQEYKEKIYCF